MKIAAVTLVRNDSFFLKKWIAYYGGQIGLENLYILCHGSDWGLPELPQQVSRLVADDYPSSRYNRNIWSARYVSDFAAFLMTQYDAVIRTDVDEFVVPDPASGQSLTDIVAATRELGCVSALGTDVIQNLDTEPAFDPAKGPVLAQRRHGIVTREFSKPVIIHHPVRWSEGFHAAHSQHIKFNPNLYLFHLALFDEDIADQRIEERRKASVSKSLIKHIEGRKDRFAEVTQATPLPGDEIFEKARAQIAAPRPRRGPRTRPGHITDGNNLDRGYLIEIPERFSQVL
jgi:hypothetical protein